MGVVEQTKESRDEVIRSRLLHSLGIYKTKPTTFGIRDKPASSQKTATPLPSNIGVRLLSNDEPIRRSLNDINEHKGHYRRPSMNRKRLVRFNNVVTEKEIASHRKYSDRIRRTLWSDPEEIKENAYRNQIEFQAEGMDWESVLENDEMYVDAKTGELIHPFWVESDESRVFS
mmetsp:Transcript_24982/g.54881  ORF Transcript_24982/g.54881 Transcript_24982/m.54881 type:complete len:173 (+) Transcript_24982:144-662(+)